MIVRNLDGLNGTDRVVRAENWESRRLLLAADGMGFSMHDTIIKPGTSTRMCYQHHVEAVYCVAGKGRIEDLQSGKVYEIVPGTIYALDGHEPHVLTADSELRLICVFNPALVGPETHDENGVYPLLKAPAADTARA